MEMRASPHFVALVLGSSLLATHALCQSATPANPPATSATSVPNVQTGPDANTLVQAGMAAAVKGDLPGAIANFDNAIKVNPKYAPAYEKKGFVLMLQHKPEEAIPYFDDALKIDPTYQEALFHRGLAKGALAHFDEAVKDFSSVLQMNPTLAVAYLSRGSAKYFMNDFDGAIADTTQALSLNPALSNCYFYRGLAKRAKGDRAGQIDDFQKTAVAGSPYGAFWVWIAKSENGDAAAAHTSLSDFFNTTGALSRDDWTRKVGDFLLGKITQDALLAKAASDDPVLGHTGEAWFFIAVTKHLAGDIKAAREGFLKCAAAGNKESIEYAEAQHELAKLPKP